MERKHRLNSYASSTPATDGESVFVTFLDGTRMMVAAYDFSGKRRWEARPGEFHSVHGYCSSPVLFEDLVIVNGDHDGDAYLVALDRESGKTVWKTQRENKTRSYSTPIIRRIDGRGNVTDTHVVWHTQKGCSYVPSPIASPDGKYFLVVSDDGIASLFEAATGRRHWMKRIGPHYSASLVSAEGLVHFLSDAGVTTIVRPGPQFEVVATNQLGEACYASPAISRGQIFIRAERHLVCIGAGSKRQARQLLGIRHLPRIFRLSLVLPRHAIHLLLQRNSPTTGTVVTTCGVSAVTSDSGGVRVKTVGTVLR